MKKATAEKEIKFSAEYDQQILIHITAFLRERRTPLYPSGLDYNIVTNNPLISVVQKTKILFLAHAMSPPMVSPLFCSCHPQSGINGDFTIMNIASHLPGDR